jgi:hypothetical protein
MMDVEVARTTQSKGLQLIHNRYKYCHTDTWCKLQKNSIGVVDKPRWKTSGTSTGDKWISSKGLLFFVCFSSVKNLSQFTSTK